ILRNIVPGIFGLGILQLMGLINLNFASQLPEGSHSYIYWADRILDLPQSLIAVSLGAALLPALSEHWSRGNKDKMIETAQRYMRLFLFLGVPSAIGMFVLSTPIVEVLFMRGKFTTADASVTAAVVQIYAILLLAS